MARWQVKVVVEVVLRKPRNKRNSKAVLSGKRLVLAISSNSNNHKVLGVSAKRAVLDNLLLVLDNNNKALDLGNNKVLDLDNNKIPD